MRSGRAGGTVSAARSLGHRPKPLNMSASNNTHENSVLTSATSSSNNHPRLDTSRRSAGSGGGAGGGSGGGASGSGGGAAAAGGGGNPTPACASCKYQRRKCTPDCTLAPYFPADHQRQFLNAHRLFGVANILKILRGLDPSQRPAAMNSIIFQSDARAQDPVGGCYRIILELERQIDRDTAELQLVLRQLAVYRAQAQQQRHGQHQHHHHQFPHHQPTSTLPEINMIGSDHGQPADGAGDVSLLQQQQQEQQQLYFYTGNDAAHNQHYHNNNGGVIPINGHCSIDPSPLLSNECFEQQYLQQRQCADDDGGGDDDDVKPSMEFFDARHRQFFGGEEGHDQSDVSPDLMLDHSNSTQFEVKGEADMSEHETQHHDLKSAASLFKLTNCDMSDHNLQENGASR